MADDVVATFMAITNCEDEEIAVSILAANDFVLEPAILMYQSNVQGNGPSHSTETRQHEVPTQQQHHSGQPQPQQHRFARLVDDDGDTPPRLGVDMRFVHGAMQRLQHLRPHNDSDDVHDQDAVFRSRNIPQHVVSGSSASRGGMARFHQQSLGGEAPHAGELSDESPALDGLFRSPKYAFTTEFGAACSRGKAKRQWILLNILRQGDFRSACMNRDLWRNQLISEIVPQMFVFCQYTHDSSIGSQLASQYHVAGGSIPCLLIIHPVTRALALSLNLAKIYNESSLSFSSEALLEKLTEFVEKNGQPEQPPDFDSIPETGLGAVLAQQYVASGGPTPQQVSDVDDDDEQLRRALALSMEDQTGTRTPVGPSSSRQQQTAAAGRSRDVFARSGATPNTALVEEYDVDEPISLDDSTQSPATKLPRQEATPSAIIVPEVDLVAYTVPPAAGFRLRLKLPGGVADLSLSPATPVAELQRFAVYKIFAYMQSTKQEVTAVPAVEFLAGFPPARVPFGSSTTLETWAGVRKGDALVVHQTQ